VKKEYLFDLAGRGRSFY